MRFNKLILAALFTVSAMNVNAGGLLTNTNQSIAFLRNPAREGCIGIDGVYSNPAGVAFMNEGLHFNFNWQNAWQTRSIDTTNPIFTLSKDYTGQPQHYEGKARAPFIPSIMAAYNTGKWSFQFGFAVTGGGGKCEFANGLGSFESAVGNVGSQLAATAKQLNASGITVPNVTGYDADSYMQGKQFYFGFTLGAAYKFNKHLSGYAGLRVLYGVANYKAKISNIKVISDNNSYTLPEYITAVGNGIQQTTQTVVGKYVAGAMLSGMTQDEAMAYAMQQPTVQQLVATGEALTKKSESLSAYYNGVDLQDDQTGWGIAPIFGVDYKINNFNFAAKYEFRTAMRMKNKSTVLEASQIAAVNQFKDGTTVREDQPALLALGAQWSILPSVRVSAGWHHFFDKSSKKTYCYADANGNVITADNKNDALSGGTNEYLGGVEVDPIKKLTLSGGVQFTRYGLTDSYMSDMSFVVNSWSFGVGAKYQINEKVAVEAAYFQTNYEHYNQTTTDSNGSTNDFTRTNKVLGLGVELSF